ncbi:hypothetical protein HN51_027948 [Arachis hypogaea]
MQVTLISFLFHRCFLSFNTIANSNYFILCSIANYDSISYSMIRTCNGYSFLFFVLINLFVKSKFLNALTSFIFIAEEEEQEVEIEYVEGYDELEEEDDMEDFVNFRYISILFLCISLLFFLYVGEAEAAAQRRVKRKNKLASMKSEKDSVDLKSKKAKVLVEESEPISSADQVTSEIDHIPTTSGRCEEAVVNEINQFRDLLSEIDCKIGKLTLARLLTAVDSLPSPRANNMVNTEEILQLYDDLMRDTIRLEYLALLLKQLTEPLRSLPKVGSTSVLAEAVEKVVEFMNTYFISQEDFDTIVELSKFKFFVLIFMPSKCLMKCHIYASKQHYKLLVDDVNLIESGRVTLPAYNSTSEGSTGNASDEGAGKKGGQPWNSNSESNNGSKASRSDQEWHKGIAWTKDEHRSLLRGRTMGRWLKDQKERKKQEIRTYNAQLHAAVSVASIAAAVAAIAASIECTL